MKKNPTLNQFCAKIIKETREEGMRIDILSFHEGVWAVKDYISTYYPELKDILQITPEEENNE